MAKHLHIVGIVQGVGYRAAFARKAGALKLSGWVRNRRDGSVEAVVCGEADALDRIIAWARHGPDGAYVREISVADTADIQPARENFEILPTE
jgi:acylphosphatase